MRTSLLALALLLPIAAESQVVIHRVLVDPEGNESSNSIDEIVEIRTTEDVDLAGWSLRSTPPLDAPDEWSFPSLSLEAEMVVQVHWETTTPDEVPAIWPPLLFTEKATVTLLNNDGGDLALYDPAGTLVHYVAWASAGQALEEDAVAAGKWTEGEVVDRPAEGEALVYDGDGFAAADWRPQPYDVPTAIFTTWGQIKAD